MSGAYTYILGSHRGTLYIGGAALRGCDFFDFFHNFGGWKALESIG
jgi:hypothetical protein